MRVLRGQAKQKQEISGSRLPIGKNGPVMTSVMKSKELTVLLFVARTGVEAKSFASVPRGFDFPL
jgi:hypothetical protein